MDEQIPQPYNPTVPDAGFEPGTAARATTVVEQPTSELRLNLGDIYYTLFRHKWKIISFTIAGVILAAAAYLYWPVGYASFAKIFVRGVQDTTRIGLQSDDVTVTKSDPYGEAVVNTEMEFLKSFNLAMRVAEKIGPERILNGPAEEVTTERAAGAIFKGLSASVTSRPSTVVHVAFRHPNRDVVQPVLKAVLEEYQSKRAEVYRRPGDFEHYLQNETEKLRLRLAQIEAEIQTIRSGVGVLSLDEAKRTYTQQLSKLQQDRMEAEAALAEQEAIAPPPSRIEIAKDIDEDTAVGAELADDVVGEYLRLTSTIGGLRQREQEYLLQYTPESIVVRSVRSQIAQMEARLQRMEQEHPALASKRSSTTPAAPVALGGAAPAGPDATTRIASLRARIATLTEQLERTQEKANAVSNAETMLSELERQRDLHEKNYRDIAAKLEGARMDNAINASTNSDVKVVEEPTIPVRETKQLHNTMLALLVGGLAMGLGLAFAIDLFLDQSVKRPTEVESRLNLPLFLSIPHLAKSHRPQLNGSGPALLRGPDGDGKTGSAHPPATVGDGMRVFFEALRDRLVYYFEIRNLTRKPKLVAVTSCGKDAGVSTIAAGLAASLSETGDGNVLLVDMNPGQRAPHYFHKGDLKLGLNEALEEEKRPDAMVREKLYMVSHTAGNNQLSRVLPTKFTHLVPKLKASDYEYIIFDMPPVGQLSVTPQLARYMDMVFMVVESEETNRDAVKRASAMLADAGSKVAVVLNKTRNYLPRALQQEYLNEA